MKRILLAAALATATSACAADVTYEQTQHALLGSSAAVFEAAPVVVSEQPSRFEASPSQVQIGTVAYGQGSAQLVFLTNTSEQPATITDLSVEGSEGVQARFTGHDARVGSPATFDAVTVAPGAAAIVEITVVPSAPGAYAADVVLDAFGTTPTVIEVSGTATLDAVTPVAVSLDGYRVAMPDHGHVDVQLDGNRSASPNGKISSHYWTVTGPAELLPSAHVATPVLRIHGPGAVEAHLTVGDVMGASATTTHPLTIKAVDEHDVKVQVTWTGSASSDLDVHLAHPKSQRRGGIDDSTWACWQGNAAPFWPSDQPTAVAIPRAFSAGPGHDAVALADAQSGLDYDMAIRYASGRGTVDAVVTVTVRGEVVYTRGVTMTPGQTWSFGSVNPTDATVTATWDEGVDTLHVVGF